MNNIDKKDLLTEEEVTNILMSILRVCFYKDTVKININNLSIGVEKYKGYRILIAGIKIIDNKYSLALRIQSLDYNMYIMNCVIEPQPTYIDTIKRHLKLLNEFSLYKAVSSAYYDKYQESLNNENQN